MSMDAYRALTDHALLRERGVFVAEGRTVVRRVLADPRFAVESILVNEASHRSLADVLTALPEQVPVFVRDAGEIASLVGYNVHRGCLALVKRPALPSVRALCRTTGPLVILDGVSDPDNVGGVFRNAAAFGVSGVVLSPTACDPLYRKAVRTSMAAVLHVPFARASEWPGDLACVRDAGFSVLALTPRAPSVSLDAIAADSARPRKIAIAVGSEGAGVSAGVEAIADRLVRIPMTAAVDSLNVAVACGIALYALR